MFPLNTVLAVALLATPQLDAPAAAGQRPEIRAALHPVALAWELLDPREARYVLTRPQDFAADLNLARQRYHDLRDAPPLCDHARFPDPAFLGEVLSFNRVYRDHLSARRFLDPGDRWDLLAAIAETDNLYRVWGAARDAASDAYYVTTRRAALRKLRDAIGPHAYYSGCLPPPVPVWRCQRLD